MEQRITIIADGRVWFSAYVFGKGRDGRYEKSRAQHFRLTRERTDEIFSAFTDFFREEYHEVFADCNGEWKMNLTNTGGRVYKYRGPLCSHFEVDGVDLSDLLRDSLDMPELYAFDGNGKPDVVKRIEVFYHRITKFKPSIPISETAEYVVLDHTESLIIDSDSETIEQIQNFGSGCSVKRTYKVQDGVVDLLENLDASSLFSHIEGNPNDVWDNPLESRDYTVKVLTRQGKVKSFQGSYDKKGLPDDWAEFMDTVFEFIAFYGFGEILDPSVYEKVLRTNHDILYCSVTFEDGCKDCYYISDDDSIEVGDLVTVPVGNGNHEAVVKVVKKEYFPADAVPFPLEKTRHIIRKYSGT